VEFGGGGREIPRVLLCPASCGGRLRRHDRYVRSFEGKPIEIQVLQCSRCGASQACLFDFLVPGSGLAPESIGEDAARYLAEEKSYEQAGWEASEDEGESSKNRIFRAVERLCHKVNWIAEYVERQDLKPGESLWKRKEPEPPPGEWTDVFRARGPEKRKALSQLRAVLGKYMRMTGKQMKKAIAELHRASMQLAAPFSLLTRSERQRLSAPKNVRYGIM
jgi:hypothetical protein